MKLHKGSVGIGLIVFGLLFGANTHQEFPAGETIIRMFGGPVRSHGGLYYAAVAGIFLVIAGFVLASLHYRKTPWIRFKLFLFIMGLTALYPLVTEQLMVFLKWNATGPDAVEYISRESTCSYDGDEDGGEMNCTVKVNNYGANTERVSLSPGNVYEFHFKPETLEAPPHSQKTYDITFTAPGNEDAGMSGDIEAPEFVIEVLK